MIYRKAIEKDVKSVAELFNAYRVFYKKEADLKQAEHFILERLQNNDSEIFIAEKENDTIVGFVQLFPLFSSTRMEKLWLLNDLFVNPDYRGLGVSVNLIEEAKKLVIHTKACGMFLETSKSNTVGNNLYPKTGFELNNDSNYYEWNAS
ncbi:GNAT family N-acetyltransferase [Formosa algae]|uniref:Ribosomal protein S18 acetylase RimI-like enzyme n=1 Tax=Formosa algae TaxID=225843 RepID=A0A9X1CBQ8_9FLAO|nr:GNAT family N-acetyltransferase [Formosa algae]MBP1840287.1 ribosomal protein S18 acetylase RimI-like enzyme [Formosa algae]MDQ0334151.1 ribosomal protein S18 acetylase RimI-like enzyme [Formosa algae]OEI79476.1 GNAT family N-acetyltransferase [Formosa algae]